jgi:hypothetical protein
MPRDMITVSTAVRMTWPDVEIAPNRQRHWPNRTGHAPDSTPCHATQDGRDPISGRPAGPAHLVASLCDGHWDALVGQSRFDRPTGASQSSWWQVVRGRLVAPLRALPLTSPHGGNHPSSGENHPSKHAHRPSDNAALTESLVTRRRVNRRCCTQPGALLVLRKQWCCMVALSMLQPVA